MDPAHDNVIRWKHFLHYWPFVWGIHWFSVNSPHKGQWCGALKFSLICTWTNSGVNHRDAGDLRCHHAHYDITVMHNMWVVSGEFSDLVAIFNYVAGSFNIFNFHHLGCLKGGGWGCEVSCGVHHRPRGKTTTGSALDGAVFDIAQILAYLVHNMSRSQLYLGFGHFGWLPFFWSIMFWRVYGWIVFPLLKLLSFFWLTYYCSIGLCFSVRV